MDNGVLLKQNGMDRACSEDDPPRRVALGGGQRELKNIGAAELGLNWLALSSVALAQRGADKAVEKTVKMLEKLGMI